MACCGRRSYTTYTVKKNIQPKTAPGEKAPSSATTKAVEEGKKIREALTKKK